MTNRLGPVAAVAVALVLGGALLGGGLTTAGAAGSDGLTSRDIRDGGVRSEDIRTGAVHRSDLDVASVASSDVKDGSITSADIADQTIMPRDLSAGLLGTAPAACYEAADDYLDLGIYSYPMNSFPYTGGYAQFFASTNGTCASGTGVGIVYLVWNDGDQTDATNWCADFDVSWPLTAKPFDWVWSPQVPWSLSDGWWVCQEALQ